MDKMCRICLQGRAELPIFEDVKICVDEKYETLKNKLSACLHEEVQEREGYPRCICLMCNETLDILYKFIQTYKESHRRLEQELENVKLHHESEDEIFLNDTAEVESESDLTLANIKIEFDLEYGQPDILEVEEVKPCKRVKKENCTRKKRRKIYAEEVPVVKEKKIRGVSVVKKTNYIATSLLEGVFCWSGMNWSYASKLPGLPQLKTKLQDVRSLRRELPHRKRKEYTKSDPKRLCDLCGTVFADQTKLTKHKKKVHMHNQAMKCDAVGCDRVCNGPRNLRLHKARKHGQERAHVCPTCSKAFSFKSDLYNHSKRHRKDFKKKVFSCSMCDKTYRCQKSVEIHERSVHTGVRPASCTVCKAAFFHEDYLKEHMRLHTGETPFHCPVCGRGYAQRGNMKSHMRIHRLADVDEQTRAKMKPNYLKLLKS